MKNLFKVVVLSIALSIAFQDCNSPSSFDAQSLFKSPLGNVQIDFQLVEINAEEPKVVRFDNGSYISVPKNAFVDASGNKVKGKITLAFRQFDDAADIIASGISMTYNGVDGKLEQLESGGMFELQAKANNKEVFVAPDKSILTSLTSNIVGDFDFYYLEPNEQKKEDVEAYQWKNITKEVDEVPVINFQAVDSFNLKFNVAKYPELTDLEMVSWQLGQKDSTFNPNSEKKNWVLETTWDQLEISQPKFMIKEVQELTKSGHKNNQFFLSPEKELLICDDKGVTLYDERGNVIIEIDNILSTSWNSIRFLSDGKMVTWDKQNNRSLRAKDWSTIKDLGKGSAVKFSKKHNRIIYTTTSYKPEKIIDFYIVNIEGEELFHEKFLDPEKDIAPYDYFRHFSYRLTADKNHLCVYSNKGIQILDMNGKGIKSRENKKEDTYVNIRINEKRQSTFKDLISIVKKDGSIELWNWKKDKTFVSIGIDLSDKTPDNDIYHSSGMYYNAYLPILLLEKDNDDVISLWNWEKNKILDIPSYQNYNIFMGKGELIHTITPDETKGIIYSIKGKKIIEYVISGDIGDAFSPLNYTTDEEFILIRTSEEVKLYNKKGRLIKDFKKYDKNLESAYLDEEENIIVTYTNNGLITWWDMNGEIIRETKIDEENFWLSRKSLSDSILISSSFDISKEWNLKGELIRNFGRASWRREGNNELEDSLKQQKLALLFRSYWKNSDQLTSYTLSDVFEEVIDSNIYQLTLIKEEKEFKTYIYLDAKTKQLIKAYNLIRTKKRLAESIRNGQEEKLIRSFAIRKMGIYNWDRIYKYKQETLVRCNAAFNFDVSLEFSDINVFLITGENKNIVIKYNEYNFDDFYFNSDLYNKLIAILPDNKIAVFENDDFKGLDLAKIKQEKKYQFEMKILGGVEAMEALKKMTN